ncbi:MAG TPA: glycosyltransferase [Candidatus Sumerlaeota bacterium]|nr:MAG: Undecaprenyl-phosphate 4-deoxy-4-formamido-L-arabinose transferase [candidate division BRC1 bacterium ADurb.BinA292]HOE95180.1 glycosyltransferase [Candidatus Sumerlaeota bacterium]HOR27256.1 glycosyltransferase [Candidatus Sumerlaeota bacterium]HPK01123.1 glycosyltransferase [Candidatus Sumerlaeota bacterium]
MPSLREQPSIAAVERLMTRTGAVDITVVIPTLNEAGNIGELVRRARAMLDGMGVSHEILAIDGGSTDGTCEEAEQAGAVAIREGGHTYGAALRTGFAHARGEFIITMDSDLSHEPEFFEQLWQARRRADIVIASRYVAGGKADMAPFRSVLSRILNFVYTRILRIPVHDISSGFRLYRRAVMERTETTAHDFDVLEEVLIKLYVQGHAVAEVPFHYRPRKHGRSHAKLVRFALAYLKTLWRMARLRYGTAGGRDARERRP